MSATRERLMTVAMLAEKILGFPAVNGQHFDDAGLPMFGGCECCHASVGAWNAYPSRSGYLRCGGCIAEDTGYKTIDEFREDYPDE